MFAQLPERQMHRVRWVVTIGWLLLIASLFYDPWTVAFTKPDHPWSPFRLTGECVKVQGQCVVQEPYALGATLFWGAIVPSGILILLVFGHELWRRICPLSFLSQIPRALGWQRQFKREHPKTGKVRYELAKVKSDSWLGRNYPYVQFGYLFVGLCGRILFFNADRVVLALWILSAIAGAIAVGYFYGGKSWCQYFCPMAPVQTIFSEPRGLLGSKAHMSDQPITQSMCRTVEPDGSEKSACVACQSPCFDIDSERTYWNELNKPEESLIRYGYVGLVIGYFVYYYLYAGNWDYYFTGAWTHEGDQVAKVFDIGFYLYDRAIPIPKAAAVFLTFGILIAITLAWGLILEKLCRIYPWRGRPISAEQAQHIAFTVFTAVSFWTFFSYGARPSLNRLPSILVLGFNSLIVLVGSIWLYRTLRRTHDQYNREQMAMSLRKQLQRLELDPMLLEGRSIHELTPNEIYTLVKVLQGFSQQLRLNTYTGVVLDLLEQQTTSAANSFEYCKKLRQDLQLKDADHFAAMESIAATRPEALKSARPQRSLAHIHDAVTLARTIAKPSRKSTFR